MLLENVLLLYYVSGTERKTTTDMGGIPLKQPSQISKLIHSFFLELQNNEFYRNNDSLGRRTIPRCFRNNRNKDITRNP